MVKKLLLLTFLFSFTISAQEADIRPLFSDAIGNTINKYIKNSQLAYHDKDYERAQFLYDSLIDHVILNTYLDNFTAKKKSGKNIELYDYEKPIILLSTASWCEPGAGTFPALNEIAETYRNNIDFVILYWDTKENARKASKDLDSSITVLYIDELENKSPSVVKNLKHSLGLPACFLLDENKKIIDVKRTVIHPYHTPYEISYEDNYDAFFAGVQLLAPTMSIQTSLEIIGVEKN